MFAALTLCLTHTGCFTANEPSTYYGKVVPPRSQEFRWSNGGLPQTFDPAFAAAPPDTDAVRALFEGLTDYDPRTLAPVPAVATRWESADEGRVWTFTCATTRVGPTVRKSPRKTLCAPGNARSRSVHSLHTQNFSTTSKAQLRRKLRDACQLRGSRNQRTYSASDFTTCRQQFSRSRRASRVSSG